MFRKFIDVVEKRYDHIREWKESSKKKVFGYFCTYLPEELIYAAGIVPVRILGGLKPQDVSESHIFGAYCPACRDILAQGLSGKCDFIDGLVTAYPCENMMQSYFCWIANRPVSYSRLIGMPHFMEGAHAKEYLMAELSSFKESLEQWTGRAISEKDLDRAIETYNTDRQLLWRLYELRKSDPPLITGTEAVAVVISSMMMDKAEHSKLLSEVLEKVRSRKDPPKPLPRLMVLGSEIHDLELLRAIEGTGANVVIEELCTGSRYFWNEVIPQEERLAAIAGRYLSRPRCPNRDGPSHLRRPEHILDLIKRFGVQGVVILNLKFCDPHEIAYPVITKLLKQNNIPHYVLDVDVTLHRGTVRTRTEALLEMLEVA